MAEEAGNGTAAWIACSGLKGWAPLPIHFHTAPTSSSPCLKNTPTICLR